MEHLSVKLIEALKVFQILQKAGRLDHMILVGTGSYEYFPQVVEAAHDLFVNC